MKMKILIGYDGSESADAALDDLRRAGLPRETEALIISVADIMMANATSNSEIISQALTSRRVTSALKLAERRATHMLKEANELAEKAAVRVRSYFPDWKVNAEGVAGSPSSELIDRADKWKADLVVVGSHGHSALERFVLGSVSKKIVTGSNHSVRVARGAAEKREGQRRR